MIENRVVFCLVRDYEEKLNEMLWDGWMLMTTRISGGLVAMAFERVHA